MSNLSIQVLLKNRGANSMIMVTGSDGFVGSQLCRELLCRGSRVLGAKRTVGDGSRREKEISQPGGNRKETPILHTVNVGDIGPNTDWAQALAGIDAVVHLAARTHIMRDSAAHPLAEFRRVNVDGTRRLAEAAAQAAVKRFVFLSSVKVNGESTDSAPLGTERRNKCFTELDSPHPEDAYGVTKWEAEQVLREIEQRSAIKVVIIRPPLIYGPGVKANFLKLVQLIDRGIPLPFGCIHNQRSLLSLTNLVDLICCCLDHPGAAGETFLVSDGEDVSTPELMRRIAHALGKSERLLPVPEWILKIGGALTGKSNHVKRLCGSLRIDSSRVRRLLGWTPPCTMEEELALVATWWKERLASNRRDGDSDQHAKG